jgi:hypothetical protein
MISDVLYYDVLEDQLYDSSSNAFMGSRNLSIFLNNHATLVIHYVVPNNESTDVTTWTPYTGFKNIPVASSFAVDNNMLHAVKGTTTEDVTPDTTLVNVKVSTTNYVNPTGSITFILNDGSKQSVNYTARDVIEGGYAFTIQNDLISTIPSGSTVRVPEALMMKAEGEDIDDSMANEGIFVINLYALSHKLIDLLDYSTTTSITATGQHKIMSEGEVIKTFTIPIVIKNLLDYDNEFSIPNPETGTQASKAWVSSLLRQKMELRYSETGTDEGHSVQTMYDKYISYRIDESGQWSEWTKLPDGANGATFTPHVDSEGNLSWTNEDGLENPATVNIRGPQGIQGETGPQGPQGEQGPKGADGTMSFEELTPEQKESLKGDPGYTPIRGIDYWTTEDIASIESYIDEKILNGEW